MIEVVIMIGFLLFIAMLILGYFDGLFYSDVHIKELKIINYSTVLNYQITGRLISATVVNGTASLTIDSGNQNFFGNPDYFRLDAKVGNKTLTNGGLLTLNAEVKKPLCAWFIEFKNGTKTISYDYYRYGSLLEKVDCSETTEYSIP